MSETFAEHKARERAFLERVPDALARRNEAGAFAFRFGQHGSSGHQENCLTVRVPGYAGKAVVCVVSVGADNRRLGWWLFGKGTPHWELFQYEPATDAPGGAAAKEPVLYADLDALVGALLDWRARRRRATGVAPAPAVGGEQVQQLCKVVAARRAAVDAADTVVVVEDAPGERETAYWSRVRRLVAWNVPRQEDGRLPLGLKVPLAPQDHDILGERALWYAAFGPEKRRDPQVIRLGLHWLIGGNHAHRWDRARWLWDPDADRQAGPVERRGVEDLPWEQIGPGERADHLAALEAACAGGRGNRDQRVALTLLLQDAGRIQDALALWQVEIAPEAEDVLDGVSQYHRHGEKAHQWMAVAQAALQQAALWRWSELLREEAGRLEAWRREKKGRPRKRPELRFLLLPGQGTIRRDWLALVPGEKGADTPRVELVSSGSLTRLPETLWRRPPEIDLVRFGRMDRTLLDGPPPDTVGQEEPDDQA